MISNEDIARHILDHEDEVGYFLSDLTHAAMTAVVKAVRRQLAIEVGRADWMTVAEAEARGYTVNTHCYPPVAYKGPTFAPTERVCVLTDLEATLLGKA